MPNNNKHNIKNKTTNTPVIRIRNIGNTMNNIKVNTISTKPTAIATNLDCLLK